MAQSLPRLWSFEDFAALRPENGRCELHDGIIVEMGQPVGGHEKVTGFLARKITVEFDRLDLPYFIPKTALVKPTESQSAYSPDVLLLNEQNLANEPLLLPAPCYLFLTTRLILFWIQLLSPVANYS